MSYNTKPCPFCGNAPKEIANFWGSVVVECEDCGIQLHPPAWNNRNKEKALSSRIKELEDAIENVCQWDTSLVTNDHPDGIQLTRRLEELAEVMNAKQN